MAVNDSIGAGAGPGESVCPVCRAPLDALQRTHPRTCGALACMTEIALRYRADRDAAREREWQEKAAWLRAETGVAAVASVPHQSRPSAPVAPERVAAFTAHLDLCVALAFFGHAQPDMAPEEAEDDVQDAVTAAACGTCWGSCCKSGGARHAYLTPETMARIRRQRPGIPPDALRRLYLDALPEAATEDACLFQTDSGCALARRDRALTCNVYACWSLKRAKALAAQHPGAEILIAAPDSRPMRQTRLRAPAGSDETG